MNNIKTKFSIKDLENLSGIKAHTIRIWEKRYNLFEPNRTDTNIRYYSLGSLQKILNISYLNTNGYKISKIAKLNPIEVPKLVKTIASKKDTNNHYINSLKLAMFNFDQSLFYKNYEELINQLSFDDIFYKVFVPLLDEIGMLWQTQTITPAHEHFIVELIKQKLIYNIENALKNAEEKVKEKNIVYVLFLPENEIHELGLLFTNYKLISNGLHTIYLGQSVPLDSLQFIKSQYDEITFITSFTVKPDKDNIDTYLTDFHTKILENTNNQLIISGRLTAYLKDLSNPNIKSYMSTKDVIANIIN